MTRKKVKLVWIVNDAARKASLKKRRVGLMKKVSELTTLCGVDAFCIIYCPDDPQPMVWPSRPMVEQLLMRYNSKPEIERNKKQATQESYLRERIVKVQDHTRKHQRKNRDMEMSFLMWQLHHGKGIDNFDLTELHGLAWLVEEKMKEIRKRIDYFKQVPPFIPPAHGGDGGGGGDGHDGGDGGAGAGSGGNGGGDGGGNNPMEPIMTWDQWFLDMMEKNDNSGSFAGSSGTKNINSMGMLPHDYFATTGSGCSLGGGVGSGGSLGGGVGIVSYHDNLAGNNISTSSFGVGQMPLGGGIDNFMMPQYGNFSGNNNIGGAGGLFGPGMMGLGNVGGGGGGGVGVSGTVLLPHNGGGSGVGGSNINDGVGGDNNVVGGGSDLGLQGGFFGGASDQLGMPFDISKIWPHNFNP